MRIVTPNRTAVTRTLTTLNTDFDDVLARTLAIVTRLVREDTTIAEDIALQSDLGMTSLQVMELVLEIEDEFDISFPLNRLPDIQTARDLTREIIIVLDR